MFVWIAVALGAGMMGIAKPQTERTTSFFLPIPSMRDVISSGRADGPEKTSYQLLNRTTGHLDELSLPVEPSWSLLSVSPWCDHDGNLQAVGRWVSRRDEQDDFCGLGLVRLPDMAVKSRVTLDVLPTGKPCWVPGHPGEVLFPAANGELYHCNLGTGDGADSEVERSTAKRPETRARPVRWKTEQPGSGVVYLDDPAWSSEPAIDRFVFVVLSMLERHGSRRTITPSRLWWLVLNDTRDAVVAAGPLNAQAEETAGCDRQFERMPNVVVGPGGKIQIAYLTRRAGENSWRLRAARLEIDATSGNPRLANSGGTSNVIASRLAATAMAVSADGKNIYAMDIAGRTTKHPLGE
jgi:hypothetical protein